MEVDDCAGLGEFVQVQVTRVLVLFFGHHLFWRVRFSPSVETDMDSVQGAELVPQAATGAAAIERVAPGVEHFGMRRLELIARRQHWWDQPHVLRVARLLLVAHLVTVAGQPTVLTLNRPSPSKSAQIGRVMPIDIAPTGL